MIAGPSEILVIADGKSNPAHVAAYLLSQAEHDKLASAVLVTDSEDLARAVAEEIEKQSAAKNVITDILIQVNISGEESKFGVSPEAVSDLVNRILTLAHVRIKGFMTIPPFVDDPEENRCHFQNLRQLSVDINAKNIDNSDMNFLSMGMTGDYCVAAQEGATYLRVGTGIFGERDYANHTTASK
jgi:pyridoxal phosphate enzyme (YggS family)